MKRIVRAGIAAGLIVIAVCSLMTGCSSEKSSAAAGSQGDPSGKASQAEEAPFPDPKEEPASGSSLIFQAPEEGYYSNAYDEILKIRKSSGSTYSIEYSITRLLYVENAVGTYDPETGILRFSGEDDGGNVLKAAIVNKGDCLEVTVTQSSHKDAVGSVQNFYKAADPEKS